MPLELEDLKHLGVAQGFCELGMFLDADVELERIDADLRHLPEVLAVRVAIYSGLKKWDLMQSLAKKLAEYEPSNPQWWISWAFATRRAENIEAAKVILLDAAKKHPKEPMIHYNLACYECQLGKLNATKERLERAFKLDRELRLIALDDPDLEPLWFL